ncbi:hypothetical protein EX30DRAFT_18289 [Ascodesmis nigricans]|uniref:Uncharacterized protein n=1 Tax=Ascodesmis nigricans TaxID=341454 RepID=A0A4V3SJS9_9PEZI|nr:hypothetical protein EX30DRAFT_18289 [Ascodesmis nigricans]
MPPSLILGGVLNFFLRSVNQGACCLRDEAVLPALERWTEMGLVCWFLRPWNILFDCPTEVGFSVCDEKQLGQECWTCAGRLQDEFGKQKG